MSLKLQLVQLYLLLGLVLPQAGCMHYWPKKGHGGLAERDVSCNLAIDNALLTVKYLKQNLGIRSASQVQSSEDLLVRATREFRAGLFEDTKKSYNEAIQLLGTHKRGAEPPVVNLANQCGGREA